MKADDLAGRLKAKGLSPLRPFITDAKECGRRNSCDADIVVSAAVGVVGLEATYEAVKLGKSVALSNKEVLVGGGRVGDAAAQKSGRPLLPVDSDTMRCISACAAGTSARFVDWC